jgi:hypothetical protein
MAADFAANYRANLRDRTLASGAERPSERLFPGNLGGGALYYPGRRQRPSSLTAFVAFVKEWRTQHKH